jgi:alpha-L-fucosidase
MRSTDTETIMPGDTTWFTEARFGMFIHWGLYAIPGRGEWVMNNEKIHPVQYRKDYFASFNPDRYDPEAWADVAAYAGMRYAVITAKHHEGFCLWDSAHTDFKATVSGAKRDLLKPWSTAFRAKGLRTGFYYSLLDWSHPQILLDRHIGPLRDLDPTEIASLNQGRSQKAYASYMREQVSELLTGYGDIDVMWFDFSYPKKTDDPRGPGKSREDWESEALVQRIRSLRPGVIIDDRLDLPGSGDFVSPEQFTPRTGLMRDGKPAVWEACQTMGGWWGYQRESSSWRGADELIRTLVDTVSKGGNLLLNVGPTARGELCPNTVARLRAVGDWMRHHEVAIHGCGAAPADIVCPPDCRLTWNAKTRMLYVHVFAWPYNHLHIDGLRGKVSSARLLLDGSELPLSGLKDWQLHMAQGAGFGSDLLSITLPITQPDTPVPVIALHLP